MQPRCERRLEPVLVRNVVDRLAREDGRIGRLERRQRSRHDLILMFKSHTKSNPAKR